MQTCTHPGLLLRADFPLALDVQEQDLNPGISERGWIGTWRHRHREGKLGVFLSLSLSLSLFLPYHSVISEQRNVLIIAWDYYKYIQLMCDKSTIFLFLFHNIFWKLKDQVIIAQDKTHKIG